MTLHVEVLPRNQQALLRQLGSVARQSGFYLGGGTAVAIQLGHRLSLDFDWFTEARFRDPVILAANLRDSGLEVVIESTDAGTLHTRCNGIPVSFLEYRYRLLAERIPWPEYGCEIASLHDLACMKLAAVVSCGLKKDFLDVYAILETRFSLAELLGMYREKYGVSDTGHVLTSLTFFDDADPEQMPRLFWTVGWDDVKSSLRNRVMEFSRLAEQALPVLR
ncbi:MAG: nucleotidyl transferase AbiEii/AbiGii toxin family protein [Gemmatimonadetes bacterium]|nr:nucleotidyl transferase AbiEii/AbiGii toxin family protein [Gemmatimonadota bacterium]